MPRPERLSQNAQRPSVVLHWSKIMGIFSGRVQMSFFFLYILCHWVFRDLWFEACGQILLYSCKYFSGGSLQTLYFGAWVLAHSILVHIGSLH